MIFGINGEEPERSILMANRLKITQNYDNPYEAAYNINKGNPWFNQNDWDEMAKKGKIDDYLTIMGQTDKLPDMGKFNEEYRPDLLDTNRRFTAMANELYGDRENKKARTEIQFDPAQNTDVEVQLGEMSDYDYTKYLITQYKDWQLDKIRVKEEQQRKDDMNGWAKTGAFLLSVPGELGAGAMDFVDDVSSLLEGITDGLTEVGRGNKFGDGFRNAYTDSDWRVFENQGWQNDIREWERKYSSFRDIEGNYTNAGKILGGVSYSLGKATPSMALNLVSAGLGKAGIDIGTGMGRAATALYFTGLGSGSFHEMANDPRMTSVPTWQLMANATIKTSFEYMITRGMSAAFGPSQLDKLVFGQTSLKAAGEATFGAAMKRIGRDFIQEGLEELGQNFSSYLWDQTFGLAVNKKFGGLSEWNMQTAFDAFILGGLSTIGTNAMSVITTKKVNLGNKKLGKFQSFVFKGDLQSMSAEFNKVLNSKSLSTEQRLDAVGQMYASYRTIASVYGEIGQARFDAATKLLQDMKEAQSKFNLTTEQIQNNAKTIYDSIADMHKEYATKVVQDIVNAGMTKTVDVVNRGDDEGTAGSNLSEEVKEKVMTTIKSILNADKNVQRIVLTEDGNTVVTTDNAMFIPIKYATDDDGKMILDTVAEQQLVNNVIAEPSLKPVLQSLKSVFETVTNRKNVDMSEVAYNLFFNENFYKVALQVSNSDMLKVLSALEGIADKATDKTVRDAIYKKKLKTAMTAIKMALANYLVLQQNAEYQHLTMLTKAQKDAIAKQRWQLDLANRIISGVKLNADDTRLIHARVNSMPATTEIKQQILEGITSTNQRVRQLSLQALEKFYRDVFNSPYNGITYLTNDTVPNVMFNEFIKTQGLTIDTLLQPISKGHMYDEITASYGEVTGDTLLKYYQDQFVSYTNGKYKFTYNHGKVSISENTIDQAQGYGNFNKSRSDVYSGKDIDQRNVMTIKQDTKGLLNNVIGNTVSTIHKSYMTIQDAIFNPRTLTQKMQSEITKQYGELTPMNAFLYLRQYYLNKYKTVSITVLANGGFAFVDVAPMVDSLIQPEINQSMITDTSTAKDFFKPEFLQGRLRDVKIVLGTDSYYDIQKNVITIDSNLAQDPTYLRFALLHEFQHAIQAENQLNGGINADWLNLSGMNKTQKNNLIADIKKHKPELFEGVKSTDLAKQLQIVNQFVYDTSGESQAFGVDANNNLVDFYPTVIRFQGAKTTITMPWGKKYTFDGTIGSEASLDFQGTEVVPENDHAEYSEAEREHWQNMYKDVIGSSRYRDMYKMRYEELRQSVPEIDEWTRLGNSNATTVGTGQKGEMYTDAKRQYELGKKQRLLDAITPDVKSKMLEAFRLKTLPEVPMEKFMEMNIPYVRMQVTSEPGNDPFVSIALGSTEGMAAIARMFPQVKDRYIFTGTIKPKDLLGVIPSSENEGLIKPTQLNEARKYTGEYAGGLSGKVNNIQRMSMAKLDGDVNQVTSEEYIETEFSKFNFKNLHDKVVNDYNNENDVANPMLDDSWDTFTKLQEDYYNDMPKDYQTIMENYIDPDTYTNTDKTELKNSIQKYVTKETKDIVLKHLYKIIGEGYISYDEFLKLDIPYYRIQSNKIYNSNSELYSVFMGHKAAKDKLKIATELTYIADTMLKDSTDFYIVVGSFKPEEVALLGDFSIGEALISRDILKKGKKAHFVFDWKLQMELYPDRDYPDAIVKKVQNMSMAKQPGSSGPRYVSNKKAMGTNLEHFIEKNKQIQLDPAVRDFIVAADPSQLDPELWSMIGGDQKGTLTKQRIYEYLRKANKVDKYTFSLINEHFFDNDSIKTFDQLEYILTSDISQYYALRAILKQVGAGDRTLEQISHKQFKQMISQLSTMPELEKQFNKLVTKYETYKGKDISIDYENMRIPFMKYFDGSIESAGHVAAIGKMLAINGWKLPGEVSKGHSLDSNISGTENMSYGDVIADNSSQEAFESILADMTRSEKEAKIIEDLFAQLAEELKTSATPPSQREVMRRAAEIREQIEDLTDDDLDQYYIKTQMSELVNQHPTLDELQNSAPIVRTDRNVSKNIRNIASRIKNFINNNTILKNDGKRVVDAHSDIFNEDLSLKSSVLENVTREQMLETENILREINKNVRNGAYHNKKMADLQKSLEVAQKRYEREKYKNYKNSKRAVKETVVNLGGHEFTIDTTTTMPKILTSILGTSFDKLANTDVKHLTSDGERHMKMNLKTFLQENAQALTALTQGEVNEIINFYLNSLPRGDVNSTDYIKYNAIKVYMLAYLLDQAGFSGWTLSADQVKGIEGHLKTIAQSAGTDLAVWRSVLRLVDPTKQIINSLARMSGIEFQPADVDQVSAAIKTGDIAQIKAAMDNLYTTGLKLYKGTKKSYWNKAWRLQRLFMLSSPGTAVRNITSNALVSVGNTASSMIGNMFSKIPSKFKKNNIAGQYKITGTKVSKNVQSFIQSNVIDTGLLSLISDGLNKYDIRKANDKTAPDIMTDLIVRSVVSKIFNGQQFDNKALQKVSNIVFKMLSDDPIVNKNTIRYFGKMLQEDGFDISQGLNEQAMITLAEAYTLAARDYMHKPSVFNRLEQGIKESGGEAAYFMYKQLLPFASASWNWFIEGLMYTPVGLVKGILDFVKLENTIDKMEDARMRGEQVESARFAEYLSKRNMGKGVIGSIGMGIGLLLGAFGVAGIDEEDDKLKLRVGDTYVDISSIFGTQSIFLGIAITNPRKGNWEGLSIDVLDTMFNDSTLNDLFNTFRYSDNIGDWLINQPARMLGTTIPNFVKGVSRLTYNHKVQYSPGVLGQFERVATSIPGVAHLFPTKIDPYTGETQSKYSIPFVLDAVNMLTPIKIANYHVSDIEKRALELGVRKSNLTGRYSDIGNFSPDDIAKLNTKYGELNKETLNEFYNNKTKYRVKTDNGTYKELRYNSMSSEQRKSVIERIMSNNAKYAKIYVYTNNGGTYYGDIADYQILRKLGIKNVYKENPKKKGFN